MNDTLDIEQMTRNAAYASRFLKTLANERRLMILCHLVEGEKSVGELERLLQMRQPALSQQLTKLREEKLVATRRESRTIYYRMASDEALAVLGKLHELFCGAASDAEAG
ncbi:ArsR/SmtB family transcription factor [Alkalilimnicola ehrlichii MLHE-1]|uniref:Transcriptional regulator, ArsR family n=1 Tax=Alkalilimnicola ehrlichii (strain ATCC BAA-1101 / DSM 17681 / MLHE-1) TaxID=187272 RepID=Q0A932_ALKEH|nr:metalloregulator ArsR/SmtB family transcription factor [Alkalilimnicola ehrlichii]ABI56655.1 transcriptional regulator, ArsR family [Alkalilimnicola ehrlichii MLHE-1]